MLFVDLESTKLQIEQDPIRLEDLVTSRKIQIDSDKIPAWYKIFYNDSGCFSNADWWQRIFHAFLQSDRETEISAMMISGLIKSIAITEFKPSPALGNVLSFEIIFIINLMMSILNYNKSSNPPLSKFWTFLKTRLNQLSFVKF